MEELLDGSRPAKIRKLNDQKEPDSLPAAAATATDPVIASQVAPCDVVSHPVSKPDGQDSQAQKIEPQALKEPSIGNNVPNPMSKNQMKKQRKRDEWEAKRGHRKLKRKEKQVESRKRKHVERQAALAAGIEPLRRKKGTQLPITVVLDCSWDENMEEKEIISLCNQLTRCYSDNHKARFKAHLTVSSFGGRLKERLDSVLEKQYEGWKGTRFLTGDFVDVGQQAPSWMTDEVKGGKLEGQFSGFAGQEGQAQRDGEVIYLSSDSSETLTELKPYSTYIIGGLVDKNRYKGICHAKAVEKGVKTAKLPISDYMHMATRPVLAVNHVNEIMLRWLEFGDWGQAFSAVMPKRKGGKLKDTLPASREEEDDNDDDDDDGEGDEHAVEDELEAAEDEQEDGSNSNQADQSIQDDKRSSD